MSTLLEDKRKSLAGLIRVTAKRISEGAEYRWAHQGRCNCGHLAQTLTGLSGGEIHSIALYSEGEWVDHVEEFCEISNRPVNELIREMLSHGLEIEELHALERLNSDLVLRHLPEGRCSLDYRLREDVVTYMETWADVIEAEITWYRNSKTPIYVNNRIFVMHQPRTEVPDAIDENPASGSEPTAKRKAIYGIGLIGKHKRRISHLTRMGA
tara:strand:+ start:161 stop:793 length:633 start_codon:yes stop_codon:yes gene_type:complete